jgi:hypothetical protein
MGISFTHRQGKGDIYMKGIKPKFTVKKKDDGTLEVQRKLNRASGVVYVVKGKSVAELREALEYEESALKPLI